MPGFEELGPARGQVLTGEFGGTLASMAFNATLGPVGAAVGKTAAALLAIAGSYKTRGGTSALLFQLGIRMLTSVLEQTSYVPVSRQMIQDLQAKKLFYTIVHEWAVPQPAQSQVYVPPPPPPPPPVVPSPVALPPPPPPTPQPQQPQQTLRVPAI